MQNIHQLYKMYFLQADSDSNLSKVQEQIRDVEGKKKSLEQQVSAMKVEKESAQKATQPTTAQKTVLESEYQELSAKLLDTEQQLTKSQTSMNELLSQVEQKNKELQVFKN